MVARRDRPADLMTACGILVERSPVPSAVTAGDAHVLRYANPAFCRLFGAERDALVGRPFFEAFSGCGTTGVTFLLDRVYRTGEGARAADLPHDHAGRAVVYLSYTVSPLADDRGGVAGLFLQVDDSTEQVLARRHAERVAVQMRQINERLVIAGLHEKELSEKAQAAERRAAFLAEASAQLAASLDYDATLATVARFAVAEFADYCTIDLLEADGSIRRVAAVHKDPARAELVRKLHGYPPDPKGRHPKLEVLRTGRSTLVPEISDSWLAAIARDADHLALLRDLDVRSCMIVPLMARGRVLGALAFLSAERSRRYGPADLALAEELARRVALALDNARLHQEAHAAIRMREEFLARASHELRTPLTVIKGHLALLAKRLAGGDPATVGLAAVAHRHADRMTQLIAGLLDASRLAAGRLTLNPESLDLKAVVAEAVAQVTPTAQEKGVTLVDQVAPDLSLTGDRLKLEQVLINLLTNAIKHTPTGGTICVEGLATGGEVKLSVRDTGEGIAREHLERIFEPFFQVGSASGRQKGAGQGTGLGLALVRGVVELHGGRVWAESDGPGCGSAFVLWLPRRTAA